MQHIFEVKCQGKMTLQHVHTSQQLLSVRAPGCTSWQIISFVWISRAAYDYIKSKQRLYMCLTEIPTPGTVQSTPFWPITGHEPYVRHWLKWKTSSCMPRLQAECSFSIMWPFGHFSIWDAQTPGPVLTTLSLYLVRLSLWPQQDLNLDFIHSTSGQSLSTLQHL